MRKYAANFEGTAYLAENDKEYEHRENYSMGGGMYLERNKYSGWTISKRGRSQHLSESTSKGKRSETADNIRRSFNAQS